MLKRILIFLFLSFLTSCASIFTPSNPDAWMEREKNACLPTAIAFREGLRKYNVWSEVVGYQFDYTNTKKKKSSGHAIVAVPKIACQRLRSSTYFLRLLNAIACDLSMLLCLYYTQTPLRSQLHSLLLCLDLRVYLDLSRTLRVRRAPVERSIPNSLLRRVMSSCLITIFITSSVCSMIYL